MDDIPQLDSPRLTDFMDLATLQEIQDSFAAVANVKAVITDASGAELTQPAPSRDFVTRQRAIEQAEMDHDSAASTDREYIAPIMVNDVRLGTIRMTPSDEVLDGSAAVVSDVQLNSIAHRLDLGFEQIKELAVALAPAARNTRPAAIRFLHLLANAIARLCYQEYQLRHRINELTAIYTVATMLADARDLPSVLQRTTQLVVDVMGVKAASIRLLGVDDDTLIIRAVSNLSQAYLNKGTVRLSQAEIDRIALSAKGYEYVPDMRADPRVVYPEEAAREGIVSAVSVGMRYKGKAIGVLRVYTAAKKEFGKLEINMLRAIASQAAAAIENARLLAESIEAELLESQVLMASDVQQRMLPQEPPSIKGLDVASVYVPCHALGGDFYDFIPLPYDNVGLTIADVSGKGVPASLIVASVRAALRAQVDNIYYISEVMNRINGMLCRDTKPTEFVTLFYGVLDVPNKRMTYCNAGHPPPLLLRDGKVSELRVDNMVLGVACDEVYTQSTIDLKSGDTLLLYTDGLGDAMNFEKETFGRQRIIDAFKDGGATADIVAQHLLWTVRKFTGLTKRNDDITMMVARIG